jgi:hypothetical protein
MWRQSLSLHSKHSNPWGAFKEHGLHILHGHFGCHTLVPALVAQGAVLMARKVVKVYLSVEQKRILERICKTLEMNESEALREAFMDYAKSIGLIAKKVHGKI